MKAYKGNVVYTKKKDSFELMTDGYILVNEEGIVLEVTPKLPSKFPKKNIIDYGDRMIIPGFTDLHLHPNQYPNDGNGYDYELMPWIEKYATPSTEFYRNPEVAEQILKKLIRDLWKFGILHSVQFGPLDLATTDLLFELMTQSGLQCYLGKNHTDYKKDIHEVESTEDSMKDALFLITKWEGKNDLIHYIMTPSFAPGCSEKMMDFCGDTARKYHLPLQSHLDENRGEVDMVKARFPFSRDYAGVYQDHHIFGRDIKTVMAHCVHVTEDEIQALRYSEVYVAHCPHSNCNLASGIMPLRRFLDQGIHVGIGSDISAGHTLNMMDNMRAAMEMSKIYYVREGKAPLSTSEAFYLATKGGGEFFGKVGSFEPGYFFDALVVDDDALKKIRTLSLEERIERFIYNGDDRQIKERFVRGRKVLCPFL